MFQQNGLTVAELVRVRVLEPHELCCVRSLTTSATFGSLDSPEFSVFQQNGLTVAELVRVRVLVPNEFCGLRSLTTSATLGDSALSSCITLARPYNPTYPWR